MDKNRAPMSRSGQQPPTRDFGVLKVRQMKIKQTEAQIIRPGDKQQDVSFDRMSHERLIKIAKGTDLKDIRALSKWFARVNGMYGRAVRYISDINQFYYFIYPDIDLEKELEQKDMDKILKEFNKILSFFDNSNIQLMCRNWSLRVCTDGVFYGYICDDIPDKFVVQDLPVDYCRSRFLYRGLPLVEFNVQYFDKVTADAHYREQLLKLFPEEFQIGYRKYKAGKLQAEHQGDQPGWIVLDLNRAFKFSFNEYDTPPFLSGIPALIELQEVQDLEKEKLLQEIQKILIQTFDLDKNGQLPFTIPELQRLNQNALDMVGDATGLSVLSTVANVHMEDVNSTTGGGSTASVDAAEGNVYNQWGLSTNLFNTTGNIALEKSIIVDEAFAKPLVLQFQAFFNRFIEWKFNKKDMKFKTKILYTTIFNQKEMSSEYKELTKLGYSRFLPAIALGHQVKEITSLAKLEQQIMQLDAYMLPPFSSNTMSSETWSQIKEQQQRVLSGGQTTAIGENGAPINPAAQQEESDDKGGRPELPNDQKSDKTVANLASQG